MIHNKSYELSTRVALDWANREKLHKTKQFDNYSKGLAQTLALFKEVRKERNMHTLVEMEAVMLKQEVLEFGKDDPNIKSSLTNAIADFETGVRGSLQIVSSPEDYRKAALTHNPRKQVNGVPKDAFHEAINGHITRLGNRIKTAGIPIPEKNILMARQENMRVAKELYIELQRKALGLKEPEKSVSKGIEL